MKLQCENEMTMNFIRLGNMAPGNETVVRYIDNIK